MAILEGLSWDMFLLLWYWFPASRPSQSTSLRDAAFQLELLNLFGSSFLYFDSLAHCTGRDNSSNYKGLRNF